MATKRKTGQVIQTFKHNNTISYDRTKVGGSDHALGNYAVAMSGNNEVKLAGDGDAITGELLEVDNDSYCSVIVRGEGLQFKMGSANGIQVEELMVGATGDTVGGQTGGYVKSAGTQVDGRGQVTEVSGTAKNSIVTANFP